MTQASINLNLDITQPPTALTKINLSLVSPHDGSIIGIFTDDGTLDTMLQECGAPGVTLPHWIPTVTETDEWNPDVWIIWVENMLHFINSMPETSEPKLTIKPWGELTVAEKTISPMTMNTGEDGITMAKFTTMVTQPDPQRHILLERLAQLHTFVALGLADGSLLRNNIVAATDTTQQE